jgi:hypothetical protein
MGATNSNTPLDLEISGGDFNALNLNLSAGTSGNIVMQADSVSGKVNAIGNKISVATNKSLSLGNLTSNDPGIQSYAVNVYILDFFLRSNSGSLEIYAAKILMALIL